MTALTLIFAATTIAFPREGAVLPPIARCYVIGATDGNVTNVVVNGKGVPVSRTGAWATTIDVVSGVNTVSVDRVRRAFRVSKPPSSSKPSAQKKYEKLAYAADEAQTHPNGKLPCETTIALDPGHGGSEEGAISPHGWFEKDANLKLTLEIRKELEKLGYRVVMTRSDDRQVPLYDRPKIARDEHADAFVSVHHNAPAADGDVANVRYACVYSWNDLGQALAKAINFRMSAVRKTLEDKGTLHANFAVTRNPQIPSCLIEADFITHPEGEAAIWNNNARHCLAVAIAAGIDDWRRSDGIAK